jgi:alkylation response protein AidB-like acyl-CoA dehydrogenase
VARPLERPEIRGIELDVEHRALADTARRFCEDNLRGDGETVVRRFDPATWRRLADLGLLTLATEEGGGGALHVAAVMEQLGRAGFPGPLAETFAAGQLLRGPIRESVLAGARIATLAADSPLVAWAPAADVFVKLERDGFASLAVAAAEVRPAASLGGQPWGEVELDVSDRLGPAARPVALADLARAAYLAGAAGRVVEIAAEYVRHRRQFGRSLGSFQAVAHPLAECHARVTAARSAALFAAGLYDDQAPTAGPVAAAARLSATDAATRAAYAGHQAMGGMGFVEGTLLAALTRIARVESLGAPGLEATRATAASRFADGVRA